MSQPTPSALDAPTTGDLVLRGLKRALHSRPLAALAASAGNVLRSEHRCRLVRYLNCLSAMLHHSMTEWILGRLDLDDVYPIRQHSQMAAIQGATTQNTWCAEMTTRQIRAEWRKLHWCVMGLIRNPWSVYH